MSCSCPETNWMDGKGHDPGCELYVYPELRDVEIAGSEKEKP